MSMCEQVAVVGDVESAVKTAATGYYVNHHGRWPQYVYVPRGKMPRAEVVQSWAVRGVTLVEHGEDKWRVEAL